MKRLLLAGAATLTVATAAWGQAAPATETTPATEAVPSAGPATAPAESNPLDDIVVTARKTEERLLDAPVAVSAIGQEQIKNLGLASIDDFARNVSGLSFSQAFGRSGDRPVIRGQSNVLANVQFGVETGAAYFIDGIYYQGELQGFDPESIERVEVIKGPQSALYGRNTYAGAINYVTRSSTPDWTLSARATAAEFNEYQAAGSISGPLIPGILGIRAGGRYYTYGGQYRNQLTGERVGQEQTASGYVLLDFTPGENFKVRLRGQYEDQTDGVVPFFLQGADANNCRPGFRSLRFRQGSPFQPAIAGRSDNNNQYFCGNVRPQPNNVRLSTDPLPTVGFGVRDGTAFDGIDNEAWVASAIIDYDIAGSGFVLSSLTGYRENDNYFGSDSDFSDAFFFLFPSPLNALPTTEGAFANTNRDKTWDVSQEVRIATPTENRIRGILGAYYFKQVFRTTDITFLAPDGNALGSDGTTYSTIENRALFGLLGVKITDRLSVTGEIRYGEEDKTQIDRVAATQIFCAGQSGRAARFGFTGTCLDKSEFNAWTPRVTVDWQATDDLLFYAVYAEGNKPAGFNGTGGISATLLTGQDSTLYGAEEAKGGEFGVKATALDRRLSATLSVFYNELSAVQLTRSIPPTNPAQTTTSIVTNAGDAETKGFEIELRAAPSDRLSVNVNVAYVDAKFTSGCDADFFILNSGGIRPNFDTTNPPPGTLPFCDITGKRLPLGSEWIVNGAATYELPLGPALGDELRAVFTATYSYESSKAVQTDNLVETGDTFLLGARVGVRTDRFSLTAFGRNLTDEDTVPLATRWFDYRYGNAGRGLPPPGSLSFDGRPATAETGAPRGFFATLRKGRTFGVEGTVRF